VSDCIPLRARQNSANGRRGLFVGAKAGSNLLRISMIKLHRNGRPAISVEIYRGPTGASNEISQDTQADR
jgi:hypothetical protein